MKFQCILLKVFTLFLRQINAGIIVYSVFLNGTAKVEDIFRSKPFPYDTSIGLQFSGYMKILEPFDACEPLVEETAPLIGNNVSAVLVTESGCDLYTKLINAEDAGFKCIIIISKSEKARAMDVKPEAMWKMLIYKTHVSFIGHQDGQDLKEFALIRESYKSWNYVIEINYPQQPKPIEVPTESITITQYESRQNESGGRWMGKAAACFGSVIVGIIGLIMKNSRNSETSDGSELEHGEEQAGQKGQPHIEI